MKTILFSLSFFISSTFFCYESIGQENVRKQEWTLEKCIDYAHENNLRIRQQEIASKMDQTQLQGLKHRQYPGLNGGATQRLSFGRALDESTYRFTENQSVWSNSFGLSSSVTLFDGLKQRNSIKQQEFNLMASVQDVARVKNDVSLQIASAYLRILFHMEMLEASRRQLEITRQQIERTQKLVNAGNVARGDLLKIEAQAASEQVEVINYSNELDFSYLTLTQMLELDSVGTFEVNVPAALDTLEQLGVLPPVKTVYQEAIAILPRVKAAEYRLKSAGKEMDLAKANRSPRLSLTGTYGTQYSSIREQLIGTEETLITVGETEEGTAVYSTIQKPVYNDYTFGEQLADNTNASIMLNLTVPIFNGFTAKHSMETAKLQRLHSEYELEWEKMQLYRDIQQAFADANDAMKKYQASNKALQSARESFRYTRQKFEVGLVNSFDYNSAKNQLRMTESDLLRAKYEFIFKTKILGFYQGKSLKL